jgi:hypothetical protein
MPQALGCARNPWFDSSSQPSTQARLPLSRRSHSARRRMSILSKHSERRFRRPTPYHASFFSVPWSLRERPDFGVRVFTNSGHCAHPVHFVNPVILSKPSFLGAFPPSREILTDCGSLACFFKSRQESVQNQITEGDDSSAKNLQSIKKCGTDSNFIKVIVEQKKKHNP